MGAPINNSVESPFIFNSGVQCKPVQAILFMYGKENQDISAGKFRDSYNNRVLIDPIDDADSLFKFFQNKTTACQSCLTRTCEGR